MRLIIILILIGSLVYAVSYFRNDGSSRNDGSLDQFQLDQLAEINQKLSSDPNNADLIGERWAIYYVAATSYDSSSPALSFFVRADPYSIYRYYHPEYLRHSIEDAERLILLGDRTIAYAKALAEQACG